MGYVSSKMEVVAIIRRFDTDGDAKVNLNEFIEGMRSALILNYSSNKKIRPNESKSS
jgi:Ca2+-binding EF-hand superfamily protein